MLLAVVLAGVVLSLAVWRSNDIVEFLLARLIFRLEKTGWSLTVEPIRGHILRKLEIPSLALEKSDGTLSVFADSIRLDPSILGWLSGRLAGIDELNIASLAVESSVEQVRPPTPPSPVIENLIDMGLFIQSFEVDRATVLIPTSDEPKLVEGKIAGRLDHPGSSLAFHPSELVLGIESEGMRLSITDGTLEVNKRTAGWKSVRGSINGSPFASTGSWALPPKESLDLTVRVENLELPAQLAGVLSKGGVPEERVDLEVKVRSGETNLVAAEAKLLGGNGEIATLSGNIRRVGSHWLVHSGKLVVGKAGVGMPTATIGPDGLRADLAFSDFNLGTINPAAEGMVLDGRLRVEQPNLTDPFSNIVINSLSADLKAPVVCHLRSTGDITVSSGEMIIEAPVEISVGEGKTEVSGAIDLVSLQADLEIFAQEIPLATLPMPSGSPRIEGVLGGLVRIQGSVLDPTVTASVALHGGSYGRVSAEEITCLLAGHPFSRGGRATAVLGLKNGAIAGNPIDRGHLEATSVGDTVELKALTLAGGGGFLSSSGVWIRGRSLTLTPLRGENNGEGFSLDSVIATASEDGRWALRAQGIKLAGGTVDLTGSFAEGNWESADLTFQELDLSSLGRAFRKPLPVAGEASGRIEIVRGGERASARTEFEVRDGSIAEVPFDRWDFTGEFEEGTLVIHRCDVTSVEGQGLDLQGRLGPMELAQGLWWENSPSTPLQLAASFHGIDLEIPRRFLPSAPSIGGVLSGSVSVSGTAASPEIVFDWVSRAPTIGALSANSLSGSGVYRDRRIDFSKLEIQTPTGRYSGTGGIPAYISFAPSAVARLEPEAPLHLALEGRSRHLDFVEPFIAAVDSITGDLSVKLSITGTSSRPVRSGEIQIRRGEVFPKALASVIRDVEGRAVLKDNQLIFDELVGRAARKAEAESETGAATFFNRRSNATPNPRNLRLSGSIDLAALRHPRFALLLTGKSAYLSTLFGEIEGEADVQLSLTGRDSLLIAGEVAPKEAYLRFEFAGGERSTPPRSSSFTRYNLHFPMTGRVFLKNSQVDAELEGDMALTKEGNQPARYSGELRVLGGKFYYYSDAFDIRGGSLLFDPSDFNPRLDIQASSRVSDVEILIALKGTLREPELMIEDSQQFYSESDLLQLLTLQRKVDDEKLTYIDLKSQSLDLFGRILETELEKTLSRFSPLDEFEIEGSTQLPGSEGEMSVRVGKRISPDLFLSYRRSFSLNEPDQLAMEYQLSDQLSLVGHYDEEGQFYFKYRLRYQY